MCINCQKYNKIDYKIEEEEARFKFNNRRKNKSRDKHRQNVGKDNTLDNNCHKGLQKY